MKQTTIVPFDDYVATTGTSVTERSSLEFAIILGLFDQIAFQVTAQEVSGTNPFLTVQLFHSPDGHQWLPKNATPEVDNELLSPSSENIYVGFDDGSNPNLRFVRFHVKLSTPNTGPLNTHVRIDATLNDSRESDFARQMKALIEETQDQDKCEQYIPGGTPLEGDWGK
jgi:hypothetical protein